MAGSGRGRGRAAFTFDIEAIGFAKGAALPDVVCKPPPPFPSTDNKPVPLKTGEDEDYMLALKQDLRGTMKKMPYFLAVEEDREALFKMEQHSAVRAVNTLPTRRCGSQKAEYFL